MDKAPAPSVKWLVALAALLGTALQIWRILAANNGTFIYALDDAYIHLDLARQFGLTGVYGVNAGITASPASSILWPFLLAPFAGFAWFTYVPLALNLLAVVAAAYILPEIITRCLSQRFHTLTLAGLSLIAVYLLNLPALALMGMEHAPHVTCALFIALGLLRSLDGMAPPRWLWLVIFLSPLLRYEGAILSGAALLLLLRPHTRAVLMTGTVISLALGAFSLFLLSLGLDALPASTIVKKAGHSGGLSAYLAHWALLLRIPFILHNTLGMLCIVSVPLLAAGLLYKWTELSAQQRGLIGVATLIFAGHMVLGRYSNIEIYRYEYYLLALALPLLAYAGRAWLAAPRHALFVTGFAILWLSPMLASSLGGIVHSSQVIYLQQEQMRSFAQEHWHGSVAVNDIGLVGYNNPSFVLDLWGLADSEVLHARRSGESGWMQRLLAKHAVKLVMINDSWWSESDRQGLIKIGELERLVHSALASDVVSFYTLDAAQVPDIKEKLTLWINKLPQHSRFTFTSSTSAGAQ